MNWRIELSNVWIFLYHLHKADFGYGKKWLENLLGKKQKQNKKYNEILIQVNEVAIGFENKLELSKKYSTI